MFIHVLGAAAGGAFPQWNANHDACQRARAGTARPATQASIALSADRQRWTVINASPDLRQQIEANPILHPKSGLRSSPIAAVLLTNADVDAVAGLLNLREGTAFNLFAHQNVLESLSKSPIFEVVSRAVVPRKAITVGERFRCTDAQGEDLGLEITAFLAPGKIPLYREAETEGILQTDAEDGDTLGLEIECHGKRLVYLANCARITDGIRQLISGCDVLFMDGTLWQDEEMIRLGVGQKTGRRMGHISISGEDGAIAQLAGTSCGRKVFIHINNTNPVLLPDSPERAKAQSRGWEIAEDGMAIDL